MKSLAVLLALAFLTGFQAAVLSEEPAPTDSELDQSMLEHLQDHFTKLFTQVTSTVNETLDTMRGHASDVAAYTTDLAKKSGMNKLMTRKISQHARDMNLYTTSLFNQGREMLKRQYRNVEEKLEEIKQQPSIKKLNDEVFQPALGKCLKTASWFSDQSLSGLYQMAQKRLSLPTAPWV